VPESALTRTTVSDPIESLDPKQFILIKGARLHNLDNIDVAIPRNKFVVITGLSGSGKSSLAFDTLYAEGQRRYVESLSSYARQFLGRLDKPEVEWIKGLSPAIAIEQKVNTRNPRSTVGTSTEIFDYIKLLFARIGRTFSPISGEEVRRHKVSDVVEYIMQFEQGERLLLLSPIKPYQERSLEEEIEVIRKQGFSRIWYKNEILRIEDVLELETIDGRPQLIIDRISVNHDDPDNEIRIADSVQTAFFEGHGYCSVLRMSDSSERDFSNRFELDGIEFEKPSEHLFSFNNPYGACPRCEGYGDVIGIDEDLVVPNKNLSIYEDAVIAWKGEKMQEYKKDLLRKAESIGFPVHKPYHDLNEEEKDMLWNGKGSYEGLNEFFAFLESNTYKIQYRVMLARYRGKTKCPECKGSRLRKEASYVRVGGYTITEILDRPIDELMPLFEGLELDAHEQKIADRLLKEIRNRIRFLYRVGLGYLTLNRRSNSLSGGESQRINLATSLGSSLVGSTYILDEPSIGLHSKDTERLIKVLKDLRDLGNTVVVVEHDEDIIRAADHIIDIGPEAGTHGGKLVFDGSFEDLIKTGESWTSKYLNGKAEIAIPEAVIPWKRSIRIEGARAHNLKNIEAEIPLGCLTSVTGVSGSGKSTLIRHILYPAVKKWLGGHAGKTGEHSNLAGDLHDLQDVEMVDQNPIGKSTRSNPVTYVKAFDDIRALFANEKLSKLRAYKPKHFSFNVAGGRCEVCEGEGEVKIEMQFMADVHLRCEECKGHRYKDEILEIKVDGKNIFDVLEMTVDEAIEFFHTGGHKKIVDRLQPLQDVGLGYVHLGQSSSTLSGGEAQRVKLASFLAKGGTSGKTLFIFDEPTTGLHFHDINKLLTSFRALIERGHSILVIEHHLDVVKASDWVIDLGPEGGKNGGQVIFAGTPADLAKQEEGFTADFLKDKI
jgi:excinuclease ABC subunit A